MLDAGTLNSLAKEVEAKKKPTHVPSPVPKRKVAPHVQQGKTVMRLVSPPLVHGSKRRRVTPPGKAASSASHGAIMVDDDDDDDVTMQPSNATGSVATLAAAVAAPSTHTPQWLVLGERTETCESTMRGKNLLGTAGTSTVPHLPEPSWWRR